MRTLRMRKDARKLADGFLIAPFFAWSVTLVPRSLLLNRTETLATQAISFPGVFCVVTQHSKRCVTI